MLAALVTWAGIALAGCGSDESPPDIIQGDELFNVTFDSAGDWEEGAYPANAANPAGQPGSILAITDGRYTIDHRAGRSASFTWGQGGEAYQDVIIEVQTEQLSDHDDNLYGVACRLAPEDASDPDSDQTGYALLISGDGHYGIAQIKRQSLTFLLEWHQSGEIHEGQAANTIRAECVGDTLALYVNDTFLGDVQDDDYRRAGQVGLVAGTSADAAIQVTFDNLNVFEGTENK